jgi:hypothetical protein
VWKIHIVWLWLEFSFLVLSNVQNVTTFLQASESVPWEACGDVQSSMWSTSP